ncbi:MAG: glycolate oxidase subunit GlcF [Thalassospira sp.]|uniref:glycolate oxidase subunit GlcF n=1 Tax=Thalassospira sp. TaxID=1912094 RepID=UPI001B1F2112|nr:glycolate oxidase subunit GlcF [Thalassospira sp.]MBO6577671.1 glycolate oxidase subunit GlcF [Thalassospira sp.]MBO6801930.1 glycolate oxidase subunit GlcF [Thalassospira sp.]MBO6817469.1 glycolate oxidase subunit GlcF [Thalassospira sp.]MBO6887095.1 glycolate oxidase subunit GlcF [Thalassospira sp.]
MQTNFTAAQLENPAIAESEQILRKCVHCGFCTATCPTFVTLGDELDSPRGRIYLIKDMLENDKPATEKVVKHLDRCLSCLSCTTTCPSGVDYMHLIDNARAHIEQNYERPLGDRLLRKLLSIVVPNPTLFRMSLIGAKFAAPFARLMPGRLKGMVKMGARPMHPPSWVDKPQVIPAIGERKGRVAILIGCAQQVLETEINESTVRLLTRLGIEVVVAKGAGCCGSLVHHMGKEEQSHTQAKANIDAWTDEAAGDGLDAIVITASGCGTTIKDYGHMLRHDPAYADKAATVSGLAKDITEYLAGLDIDAAVFAGANHGKPRVAYHSACSMQHGQKITRPPRDLLKQAGYEVAEIAEGHLCCGSAGVYNLLQPEIAGQLQERKRGNIRATQPDLVATGNIGCMVQIETDDLKVLHTVQLLDWAAGGPVPEKLRDRVKPTELAG